jgi:hypothetical protein
LAALKAQLAQAEASPPPPTSAAKGQRTKLLKKLRSDIALQTEKLKDSDPASQDVNDAPPSKKRKRAQRKRSEGFVSSERVTDSDQEQDVASDI